MRIEWSVPARVDFKEAVAYIRLDDPDAAQRVVDAILDAVRRLATFPGLGRPGRARGTRELVISGLPYILPYLVDNDRVIILRLLHTARHWP